MAYKCLFGLVMSLQVTVLESSDEQEQQEHKTARKVSILVFGGLVSELTRSVTQTHDVNLQGRTMMLFSLRRHLARVLADFLTSGKSSDVVFNMCSALFFHVM